LENKINSLGNSSNFSHKENPSSFNNKINIKESVNEYEKIKENLEIFKSDVNALEEKFITELNQRDQDIEELRLISEDEYNSNCIEIEQLINTFNNFDDNIVEQITIYHNLMNKIKLCEKYLNNLELSIEYIDTNS
jgi:exonuclease VII small subunit